MDGLELKVDFKQRRSGWNNAGNKAACFERGHTYRFKAQCPIWIKKGENRLQEGKPEKGERKRGRGEKSVTFACLDEEEMGPGSEEIPESGANTAYIHINLTNVRGGND